MKVLYITSKPPYPSIDGGCFASARFLDCLLNLDLEIKHITISTEKHPFSEDAYPKQIKNKVKPLGFKLDTSVSKLKTLLSVFGKSSYNISRFYDERLAKLIAEAVNDGYNNVIFDSLYSTPYLTGIKNISKTFIRTHNVESKIWADLAASEGNILKKWVLNKLASNLKTYELDILNQTDAIFSISKDDSVLFNQQGVKTKIIETPVALDVSDADVDYNINNLFHIGSMNWLPNVEAVDRLSTIFNDISKQHPNVELHIAGSGMENWESNNDSIISDGFVKDIKAYASKAGILVSPISSGSGVKIKILEMLALGVPIITTPKGAEGLSQKDILITASTDEELKKHVISLIENQDKRVSTGMAGKDYIKTYHSKRVISENIFNELNA